MPDTNKVTFILSNINKAQAFEWIVEYLEKEKFEFSFILLNPDGSEIENFLIKNNIYFIRITHRSRQDSLRSLFGVVKTLREVKPHIIHCHLFDAALIGLLSGKLAGVKKRVYTRHHSTYNWQFNQKGVTLDKLINWLATDIVAISENVRNVLVEKENVNPKKIHLIHHGFDLEAFKNVRQNSIDDLKNKYNVTGGPIIGVIARWIEWKGIQSIIPAFKKLLIKYPDAQLVLANAKGPYTDHIRSLLKDLPEKSYRIIEFENDLFALHHIFDVYVHTPINAEIEAFGQTYVEALAAGIPSIFTLSGIAKEFIQHGKNALVVPFENSEAIFDALLRFMKDQNLRAKLIENGRKDVEQFALNKMINKLEILYSDVKSA